MSNVVKCIVLFASVLSLVESSAIPMWEFLSRDEKMSYLYNTFSNQVETYCEISEMRNCNKELIKYGLSKLSNMGDDHLDRMDPYQRGAHNIIWDSMMEGHEVMQPKKQKKPTTVIVQTSTEPSQKRQTVILNAGKKFTLKKVPSNIQEQIQQESIDNSNIDPFDNYQNTEDIFSGNHLTGSASTPERRIAFSGIGPMEVRVRPDGSPVDARLPADEDLVQFQMSKTRIPLYDTFVERLRVQPEVQPIRPVQPYTIYIRPTSVY